MTKRIIMLVMLAVFAGCAGAPGRVSDSERVIEKVVSLGPTITRNICLLGREESIAGVSSHCVLLPEVSDKKIAGDMINVNLEQILSLSPDVVLATDLVRPETLDRIRSFGIDVKVFPEPRGFEEMCEHFIALAEILGEAESGRGIIEQIKEDVSSLRKIPAGGSGKGVLVQIGSDPLWVSPRSSFINDIIEFAGGVNLGPETGGMLGIEEALRLNPDVILIVDMGIGEEQRRIWENYPALSAVRHGRVHLVDSYTFCSPSPPVFLEALEKVYRILNG